MPAFTAATLGAGPHRITQTFFDSKNLPYQTVSFASPSAPNPSALNAASTTAYLNTQTGFTNVSPIGAGKTTVTGNYLFQKSETWRDVDGALSENGMKSGTTPVFNLSEGWIPTGEVTQWNAYNQPKEAKVVRSNRAGDESYSSTFYEGLRSQAVASITNSKLDNCAILMAENGNAGLPKLDEPGKWEASAAISYVFSLAHTGRYSLKVVDSYGPTINRYLQGVPQGKFGFRVSAWIFGTSGSTPGLYIERRRADNSVANTISGTPVQGWWSANQWTRWEANLSYADLTAGGLFSGSGDYLRIYAGTGAPKGNGANIVYVDDFVCMPSNASYGMATYDFRGSQTSATNADHVPSFIDLGVRGEPMAIRDDRFRIHGQSGIHRLGEN
jgi:hypothetical protein